jgi:hypothetical protein
MDKQLLTNSYVASAAYGDLKPNMSANRSMEVLMEDVGLSKDQAQTFLGVQQNASGEFVYITNAQGQRTTGHEVVAVHNDNDTGYSGVLFRNVQTQGVVLANRGTELSDWDDIRADIQLIRDQVSSQFNSMSQFMNEQIANGNITKEQDVTMTGHSLGGALTQMGTAAYPSYIDQAYTYNSPGAKELQSYAQVENGKYIYKELSHISNATGEAVYKNEEEISQEVYEAHERFEQNRQSEVVHDKITNVRADSVNDVISQLGEDIGHEVEYYGRSHSILAMNEILEEKYEDANYLINENGDSLMQRLEGLKEKLQDQDSQNSMSNDWSWVQDDEAQVHVQQQRME